MSSWRILAMALQSVSLLAFAALSAPVPDAPELLGELHFEGGDSLAEHFRLGTAMGQKFKSAIQERMGKNVKVLLPLLATDAGEKIYDTFLANHNRSVPNLVREVEGIAQGSGVPFKTVFAVSLSQELQYFLGTPHAAEDHCSDYMFCNEERCVGGHNEDGALSDHQLFLASVRMGDSNFTVVNYMGDLVGGMSAMAFNAAGFGFSLNWVGPPTAATDGLGRNYISRLLLQAKGMEDAISIVSKKHIGGHNYQLFDFVQRRIVNVEVVHDMYAVRPISSPFFHTNEYVNLVVPNQTTSSSSIHRTARMNELPAPQTSDDILAILGDQADRQYPIFHDQHSHDIGELSDWTLASALYDLDACSISLMQGNPANLKVLRHFNVYCGDRIPRRARSTTVVLSI